MSIKIFGKEIINNFRYIDKYIDRFLIPSLLTKVFFGERDDNDNWNIYTIDYSKKRCTKFNIVLLIKEVQICTYR